MARWGEGDPRWIVEERPDATNVNNWHWVEKNATPWSKDRLKELLTDQSISKGSIKIDLTEFKKIEGEATANNRKAKLIFLFEWVLEINFIARVTESDLEYKGHLEIPNLSDENEAHEVDVNLNLDTQGPYEAEIRHLVQKEGLNFIRKQIETYIRELKEEFSKGIILPTDKPKPQVIVKGKTTGNIDKKSFQNEVITSSGDKKDASTKKSDTVKEVKSYEAVETFKIPPDRLYEFLTIPELVKRWAGDNSRIEIKEGGEFLLYNGNITGVFEKVVENKELLMKWRTKKYPDGHFARVTLTLKDQSDSTDLAVKAVDVPESNYEETETGFNRYYFQAIGRTFGCGMKIW